MLRTEDIRTFSELSHGFWADTDYSGRIVMETLSAVSVLELSSEHAIERAAGLLLERVARQGMAGNAQVNLGVIARPFYRLLPEQRFILVALHRGNWSYARLSRILGKTEEQIEELAWQARVELAALAQNRAGLVAKGKIAYPVGSAKPALNCPDYLPHRPWTQQFLDEECASGSERMFLQNHLAACASCRQALMLCKDVYFSIEELLPRIEMSGPSAEAAFVRRLERICRQGQRFRYKAPIELSLGESLRIFFGRRENQWLLAGVTLILVLSWKLLR